MVVSCCVPNCKERQRRGSGISFHTFPHKSPDLVRKWIRQIRRDSANFWPLYNNSYRVCSRHFTAADYKTNTTTYHNARGAERCIAHERKIRVLMADAYPTVFPNFPSYSDSSVPAQLVHHPPPIKQEMELVYSETRDFSIANADSSSNTYSASKKEAIPDSCNANIAQGSDTDLAPKNKPIPESFSVNVAPGSDTDLSPKNEPIPDSFSATVAPGSDTDLSPQKEAILDSFSATVASSSDTYSAPKNEVIPDSFNANVVSSCDTDSSPQNRATLPRNSFVADVTLRSDGDSALQNATTSDLSNVDHAASSSDTDSAPETYGYRFGNRNISPLHKATQTHIRGCNITELRKLNKLRWQQLKRTEQQLQSLKNKLRILKKEIPRHSKCGVPPNPSINLAIAVFKTEPDT